MREILFRGKRIDNGEWVYGSLRVFGGDRYLPQIITPLDEFDICHFCDVDPSTVGQYTGLTDKNGKRIFEGDIVKVEYTGRNRGLEGIGEVVFKDCKFALLWGCRKEVVCLTHFCNVEFEVIGNIHDHPELLEVHHE